MRGNGERVAYYIQKEDERADGEGHFFKHRLIYVKYFVL